MTSRVFKRPEAVLLLAIVAIALVWRWHVAGGLEARWDQAGHYLWLESTLDSSHLLPHGPLEADDSSALHNLLRPIASQPHLALTATDWVVSLPFLALGGVSYDSLLLSGMVASALSVGLLALALLRYGGHATARARLIAASVGAASLLLNAYSAHYSAFVLHNFGVFFLLLCAVTLEDLARAGGRKRLLGAVILAAALYSHWSVLLLLPLALVARLFFAQSLPWRRRAIGLLQLGPLLGVILAPLAALMLALPGGTPISYMEFGQYGSQPVLGPLLHRIGFWFAEGGELFSYPGLAAGIAGLVLLARRGACVLPAWLLLVHFLLTALMPGFTWNGSNTYLRTYLYVVPLLSLGIGALALEIAQLRPVVLAAFAGLVVLGHFAPPFGQAICMTALAERSPAYRGDYMAGQGALAAAFRLIGPQLPDGATVIASDWGVRDMVFSVADHPSRRYHFPFALITTLNRVANGTLADFFHRRGLDGSLVAQPLYVVGDKSYSAEELAENLRQICGKLDGAPADLKFTVEPLVQQSLGVSELDSVSFYRVTAVTAPP